MEPASKSVRYILEVYLPESEKADLSYIAATPFAAFAAGDLFIPDQKVAGNEAFAQGLEIDSVAHSVTESGDLLTHKVELFLTA